jgi:hypothetical protein
MEIDLSSLYEKKIISAITLSDSSLQERADETRIPQVRKMKSKMRR